MPVCIKAQRFAEGLSILARKWDDAFINQMFGQVLRRGGVWEKMMRDIADFTEPDRAVDGLKKLYQRMRPQNRGNVGRIFFDKEAFADAVLYQYRALDGPMQRERFLKRWLELENAGIKNLDTVANALNGNNGVRGADYVMDFTDNITGGRFNLVREVEMKSVAGQQGVDLVFKQRVQLPDGSWMRFGEFKSGSNQEINPKQGLNHLEAIVRRANGNAAGVDEFRFILNRRPPQVMDRDAFRFLRELVENAGKGSANRQRAIDRMLDAVKAQVGEDPRNWKGQLTWGGLTQKQQAGLQHVVARFFYAHTATYPAP